MKIKNTHIDHRPYPDSIFGKRLFYIFKTIYRVADFKNYLIGYPSIKSRNIVSHNNIFVSSYKINFKI